MRDIVILSGSSNQPLAKRICDCLGVLPGGVELKKFANGEISVRLDDSVREKDVFIIQSGSGKVNDNYLELLLTMSACKMASAKRITVVSPLFFYSRQAESPSSKKGVPSLPTNKKPLVDSVPPSPQSISRQQTPTRSGSAPTSTTSPTPVAKAQTATVVAPSPLNPAVSKTLAKPSAPATTPATTPAASTAAPTSNHPYKSWVAQSGTLIADLLSASGAQHIVTMDLHDPQFQGFFDIPVDNLYSKPLIKHYIKNCIPNYEKAVIVSPDAGGAKRAAAIADSLSMSFAMIHKERRQRVSAEPPAASVTHPLGSANNDFSTDDIILTSSATPTATATKKAEEHTVATTMLVGDVKDKVCILIDDLVDTGSTLSRAAHFVKEEGASYVYAIITHGIFSGDALTKIHRNNVIDKIITTNTVDQAEHVAEYKQLAGSTMEVLDVSKIFAEAIRRINNGESVSLIYDQGW